MIVPAARSRSACSPRSAGRCCSARSVPSSPPPEGSPSASSARAYLLALAVAIALAAYSIGTILSTALLVGPAATALRLTRSPARAIATATAIGIAACWLGILLAYDSYDWYHQSGESWPVSFFVVTLIFLGYLLSGLPQRRRRRRAGLVRDPAREPGLR